MTKKTHSNCPVYYALDFIGDKWSLIILRDIMLEEKKFFLDFIGSHEGIATNILTNRLANLESDGFINKIRDTADKKRFVYSPTKKGLDILPVIIAMITWSSKYIAKGSPASNFMAMVNDDPVKFEKDICAKFSNQTE
ncbi:MAG: helix-turn-helix transcriptional regulator [Kordiimonadaceae bacterium]|nr:helix-turn-helix transcriptional regulator [Kordiimonadaceae bacterium]MBT7583134.1 helix-turn-helix transcriptional regulator [Kordiimonadaceae bacterium]